MVKTCSEVGGVAGRVKPFALPSISYSCKTVSSEEEVTDEERDKAGVDVGDFPLVLARASACERAER